MRFKLRQPKCAGRKPSPDDNRQFATVCSIKAAYFINCHLGILQMQYIITLQRSPINQAITENKRFDYTSHDAICKAF
jgi:hypothetical protein